MHDETHLFRKMKVNSAFDRYSFSMIQFFISQGHCEFHSFMLISAYDNRFDNITLKVRLTMTQKQEYMNTTINSHLFSKIKII